MGRGFELEVKWKRAAPDGRQELLAGLDRAFGPAMLLRLEAIHVHRQLGGGNDIWQKDELPAGQLRAITQIEVLRQRIVLPAPSLFDARAAPEPRGAVEVKEAATAAAGGLL